MSADKMLEKLWTAAVLTLFFLMANAKAVYAYDAAYVNPETGYEAYIIDDEDLLDADEEERLLSNYLVRVTEYGGAAFVTTSSGDAEQTAKDYCYELFNNESATTLLIDMGDRRISIMSSGGINKRINRNYANIITDNIYRYATRGDYYYCAGEGFDEILILLDGGRIAQPMRYISNLLLAAVLALLINFIYVWVKKGRVSIDNEALITAAAGAVIAGAVGKNLVSSHRSRRSSDSGSGSGGGFGGGGGGGFSGSGGSHGF